MLLNSKLAFVAAKYNLFGETDAAKEELANFKRNVELIHEVLERLQHYLKDDVAQRDRFVRLLQKFDQLGQQLNHLTSSTRAGGGSRLVNKLTIPRPTRPFDSRGGADWRVCICNCAEGWPWPPANYTVDYLEVTERLPPFADCTC